MTGEAKPVLSDVPHLINRETLPLLWEADHVGKRLLCRPLPRLTGCRAYNSTVIRPRAVEIQRMDAALEWLRELHDLDSGMALVTTLWALRSARGRSIKKLCAEKQWAPHTFFRKRAKALETLAQILNARGVPVF